MNGFTEPRASGASERPGPGDLVLTWDSSFAMLPLVGRIATDIVHHYERLGKLQPEQARLERNRRTLDWAGRSRRYQVQEELLALEKALTEAISELASLGVVLLEGSTGLVGFPTMVNDRRAYFSWRPGEDGLKYWNFAEDTARHPVPESWTRATREITSKGRSRPQK
jgi:hypothetical protein